MSNLKSKKKSGSYRSSLDIVHDILIVTSVSVKKTRIMYQANLSFVQLNKYLNKLLKQDLITFDRTGYYSITQNGMKFLELYDNYVENQMELNKQFRRSAKDRSYLEKICSGSNSNV